MFPIPWFEGSKKGGSLFFLYWWCGPLSTLSSSCARRYGYKGCRDNAIVSLPVVYIKVAEVGRMEGKIKKNNSLADWIVRFLSNSSVSFLAHLFLYFARSIFFLSLHLSFLFIFFPFRDYTDVSKSRCGSAAWTAIVNKSKEIGEQSERTVAREPTAVSYFTRIFKAFKTFSNVVYTTNGIPFCKCNILNSLGAATLSSFSGRQFL